MKPHLAVDRLCERSAWDVVPFRWVADPVRDTNAHGQATLLSLASEGHLYPRPDRSEGAQASSEETILRGPLVEPDDLVVNPMWLVGGGIAVSAVAGTVSPDYRVYRLDPAKVDPRFIHYLLRSNEYRDQYQLYTRADTTFDRRVSRSAFESMPVLVPRLDVQRRVADMLDAETARIDTLIDKNRQVIEALAVRERSKVMSLLPDAGLATDKGTPVAPLWMMDSAIQTGPFGSQLHQEEYVEGGIPVINPSHLVEGQLEPDQSVTVTPTKAEELKRHQMQVGDVIFGRRGELGRAALARLENRGWVVGTGCLRLRFLSKQFDPGFFLEVLSSPAVRSWFHLRSRGATMANLNEELLGVLPVPAISLADQEQIAADIREVRTRHRRLSKKVERQIDLLETRRRSLITAAVTGQLTV